MRAKIWDFASSPLDTQRHVHFMLLTSKMKNNYYIVQIFLVLLEASLGIKKAVLLILSMWQVEC